MFASRQLFYVVVIMGLVIERFLCGRVAVIVLSMFVFACSMSVANEEEVRKNVRLAVARHQSLPFVKMEGRITTRMGHFEKFLLVRSGIKIRFDGDCIQGESDTERDESRQRYAIRKKTIDCDTPSWLAFDGKKYSEYSPLRLTATTYSISGMPQHKHISHLDPASWSTISRKLPTELSDKILSNLSIAKLNDDTWRLFDVQKPTDGKVRAWDEIEMLVKESAGWNIVEVSFVGGLSGGDRMSISWDKQDGRWFPRKGKATSLLKSSLVTEADWEITSISFEPKDVPLEFHLDRSKLPIGTKVIEGPPGTTTTTTYVGGEEGARQFRLLYGSTVAEEKK